MRNLFISQLTLSKEDDFEADRGVVLQEQKPALKRPQMYKVVLLNDDYTPMDFVIEILESFFGLSLEKATQVMLMVHTQGKGVCGVFSKDVAETKSMQVNEYAQLNEHPLLCEIEPSEDEN